jgi:PAS domain S-box-containing protein
MPAKAPVDDNVKVDLESSESESLKVMILDDNEATLKLINKNLEKIRGYEFVTVSEPEEALDKLDSTFYCIVSDYKMPEMNGLEFFKKVREETDVPFILYTGKGSEEIASEAINTGVDNYLQKKTGEGHYRNLASHIDNQVARYKAEEALGKAEDNYRELIENAPVPIYVVKQDGIVYCNQKAEELANMKTEELVGEDPIEYVVPEDREKLVMQMQRIIKGEKEEDRSIEDRTYTFKDENGDKNTVEIYGSRIMYKGEPAIQACFRDITEQREAKEELEEKKNHIQSLLDNLPIGVIAAEDDQLLYANERFGEIFEVDASKEEFENMAVEDIISLASEQFKHPEEVQRKVVNMRQSENSEESDEAVLKTGETVRAQVRQLENNGSEMELWTIRKLGKDESVCREEVEVQPSDAAEKLMEFTETVSNDLVNPINVAKGYLDLIEDSEHEEEVRGIRDSIERAEEVIEHLSYVGKGSESLEKKETTLQDAFKGTLDYFDREKIKDNVRTNKTIYGDVGAIQTMFQKLVENSVKHTEGEVTVEVGALENGFYYQDDGPGVDSHVEERMFEPGFTTEEGATGFGLAAVEKIAEAHGWHIETEEGELGGLQIEFYTE